MINTFFHFFNRNTANPTIKKIYQNPESGIIDLFKRYRGYHGTLLESVGDEQIQHGKFDQRGNRIYVDGFDTAKRYAAKGWSDKTPVIVKISSETKPLWNEMTFDEYTCSGLGAYQYFPPNAQVRIDAVYVVEDNQTPGIKE